MTPTLAQLRKQYLCCLCSRLLSYRQDEKKRATKILNIADRHSKPSVVLAADMVQQLGVSVGRGNPTSQTVGKEFTDQTQQFLQRAFDALSHVRPGPWRWSTSQASLGIAAFDQYEHLAHLQSVLHNHPELKAALGGDYLITPDIIVARLPLSDEEIDASDSFIGEDTNLCRFTPLRAQACARPPAILHASISCKWTMRSDRAQNPRTEALNLIRNRKGNTPHIVVVTFEPLPTRLASIAMGTGDIDCTYHVALYELMEAAKASRFKDQAQLLVELVDGRRLRDISDLPFDLAV